MKSVTTTANKSHFDEALREAASLNDNTLRDKIRILKRDLPMFENSMNDPAKEISQAHADSGRALIMREQIAAFERVLTDRTGMAG